MKRTAGYKAFLLRKGTDGVTVRKCRVCGHEQMWDERSPSEKERHSNERESEHLPKLNQRMFPLPDLKPTTIPRVPEENEVGVTAGGTGRLSLSCGCMRRWCVQIEEVDHRFCSG